MKHVISIGINRVNGLPSLTAAASGAIEFENWALSQGYTTTLFTDDNGRIITPNDIYTDIYRIIQDKTCEQLILFFSGHGLLKSPNQEVWLLSNARLNPNDSINLAGSIDNARTTGIPYIVFISDACRILPNELQLTGNGSVIFPICDDNDEDTAIDILYATRPGSPAKEYSSAINAVKFGLFTESLIEMLNGQYPEIIYAKSIPFTSYRNPKLNHHYEGHEISEWTIDTPSMDPALKLLVQDKARNININIVQNPDFRIQYQKNKPYLSRFDADFNGVTEKNLKVNSPLIPHIDGLGDNEILDYLQYDLSKNLMSFDQNDRSFVDIIDRLQPFPYWRRSYENNTSQLMRKAEKIFNVTQQHSIEEGTGFSIIGNKFKEVIVAGKTQDFLDNFNSNHINIERPNQKRSALIVLENGQSVPVAILAGYIGTLIFEENRLLTVNYTPGRDSYKFYDFERNEQKIKFVRAFVASAANEGFDYQRTFSNEFNPEGRFNYDNAGSFLRREKAIDPSLGLYAVYAYMQAGKFKDVKSVYQYMREEPDHMLFDVAMLAQQLEKGGHNSLAPFCPMLALGWAYRQRLDGFVHPDIIEASRYLVPALWTTFNPEGTELIKRLFTKNVIE